MHVSYGVLHAVQTTQVGHFCLSTPHAQLEIERFEDRNQVGTAAKHVWECVMRGAEPRE